MIKVTLLGDSIRLIGYGTQVPKLLGERFSVFQPEDNCRYCKYTLRGLFDWEEQMRGSDIIHWNNGLWDVCDLFGDGLFSNQEEYAAEIGRIADVLLSRYKKVVFATTTPVHPDYKYNKNSDIIRYNEIAIDVLSKKGVIINDLYSLVSSDIQKYICDEDKIHLSEEGIRVCSEQVANIIREVSKEL